MTGPRWSPAYVGIGSNLETPEEQVRQAISALEGLPDSMLVAASGLYRSAHECGGDQPDFVNAVVAMLTRLDPATLLNRLHEIEADQGRIRTKDKWGPRTLDLDLLAYSDLVLDDQELKVPHPGIAERNFVLLPWLEVAPGYRIPGLGSVVRLAEKVSLDSPRIERLE